MYFAPLFFLQYIALIFLIFLPALYLYARYKHSYWKKRGVKTPPIHWIFGNFKETILLRKPPGKVLEDIYNSADPEDPYIGFYIFFKPMLMLRDLNLIKQFMISDFEFFANRHFGGETQQDSVGLINLLGIHQPRWTYLRHKLTPSMTAQKIKRMVKLVEECSDPMMKFIEDAPCRPDGWKEFELKDICFRYTNDVIASLAFGITTNSFDPNDTGFLEAGLAMFPGAIRGIILIILFVIPGLAKYIQPMIHGPLKYFRDVFWDSMNVRERVGNKRGDLMDHFLALKAGEQLPDYKFDGDNLLGQAVSFYVAGVEGISSAIAFALYELARHPEHEKRLYKEIQDTLAQGELTFDVVNSMVFMEQIVNESLRMYPALPIIDRVALKDYQVPGYDLLIEKDTPIYVSVYGTNHDAKYYDDPNDFIPTRSRSETADLPSSSMTFGVGPRSCIGRRLGRTVTKVVLITILKEYTVKCDKKYKQLLNPITVFTAAAEGVHVDLKRRS